jgi:hypothetical protein
MRRQQYESSTPQQPKQQQQLQLGALLQRHKFREKQCSRVASPCWTSSCAAWTSHRYVTSGLCATLCTTVERSSD